jgi:glycosyltransferase involved in cell wall biosynthesis
MQPVSVVIITKNEAENIAAAVISARRITDDIIVADSGSTDDTVALATAEGARVVQIEWKGFGAVRNMAATYANNDWIFALDADERITLPLAERIKQLQPNNNNVYGFKRLNFLYGKPVHHGEWGRDVQYRLYNRTKIKWTEVPVHESLDVEAENKKKIEGSLLHLTMKNKQEYEGKTLRYANLMAQKYNAAGKKTALTKQMLSPVFNFIQNYFFRLGFLDGKPGFDVASMSAKYTYLKYKFLRELQQQHKN